MPTLSTILPVADIDTSLPPRVSSKMCFAEFFGQTCVRALVPTRSSRRSNCSSDSSLRPRSNLRHRARSARFASGIILGTISIFFVKEGHASVLTFLTLPCLCLDSTAFLTNSPSTDRPTFHTDCSSFRIWTVVGGPSADLCLGHQYCLPALLASSFLAPKKPMPVSTSPQDRARSHAKP